VQHSDTDEVGKWQGGGLVDDIDIVENLRGKGVSRGDHVGLAIAPGVGLGMSTASGGLSLSLGIEDTAVVVRLIEDALRPRWV
jgi:hypothetical protein